MPIYKDSKNNIIKPRPVDTEANLLDDDSRVQRYEGQLLYTQDTFVPWMSDADAGSSLPNIRPLASQKTRKTITASTYTATLEDHIIFLDASSNNVTVTLPPIADAESHEFIFVAIDVTNTITIDANSSETISGEADIVFTGLGQATILGDSSEWKLIGANVF